MIEILLIGIIKFGHFGFISNSRYLIGCSEWLEDKDINFGISEKEQNKQNRIFGLITINTLLLIVYGGIFKFLYFRDGDIPANRPMALLMLFMFILNLIFCLIGNLINNKFSELQHKLFFNTKEYFNGCNYFILYEKIKSNPNINIKKEKISGDINGT